MTSLLIGKLWAGGFHDRDAASPLELQWGMRLSHRVEDGLLLGSVGVEETGSPLALAGRFFQLHSVCGITLSNPQLHGAQEECRASESKLWYRSLQHGQWLSCWFLQDCPASCLLTSISLRLRAQPVSGLISIRFSLHSVLHGIYTWYKQTQTAH